MLNIPVKRLEGGKYIFGTRQIMARIINGKLVIRVGGGFMSAEEFIEQYGKIEMLKLMKTKERECASPSRNSSGGGNNNSNVVGIGDMKEMMRNQIANVKFYEDHSQNLKGTFDSKKYSKSPGKRRSTIEDGLGSPEYMPRSSLSPSPKRKTVMPVRRSPVSSNKPGMNSSFQK
jgi:hypothetical protein